MRPYLICKRQSTIKAAAPRRVAPPSLSDYRQGFLSEASLKGGAQSAGLAFEWHFEQVFVVIGKETLPWHTPHFWLCCLVVFLFWLVFFCGLLFVGCLLVLVCFSVCLFFFFFCCCCCFAV